MVASVFEPSGAFIARLDIQNGGELPEKLQALLASGKRIPMRSYVELPGQTLSVAGLNPIRLEERQRPAPIEMPATHSRRRRSGSGQLARRQMVVGGLWCAGGLVVTVASFLSAVNGAAGGTYIVAWGAILFGGIRFLRGLAAYRGR